MIFSIIDEFNEYEKVYNDINYEDLEFLVKEAERLNFDCLSFISFDCDTIFNQIQMRDILKELDILRKNTNADQKLIDKIKEAIDYGLLEDYHYLKFEDS